MRRRAPLNCSVPGRSRRWRREGKCMAGRRPLDMSVLWSCHPLGMHEGIDAPLCGGSNRRMDPRTGLPYFPKQRLSAVVRRDKIKHVTHLLRNANVMVTAESSSTITQRRMSLAASSSSSLPSSSSSSSLPKSSPFQLNSCRWSWCSNTSPSSQDLIHHVSTAKRSMVKIEYIRNRLKTAEGNYLY